MKAFTRIPASATTSPEGTTPTYIYHFMRVGPYARAQGAKKRPAARLTAWEGEGGSLETPQPT